MIGGLIACFIVVSAWLGLELLFNDDFVDSGDGFVLQELLLEEYDLDDVAVVDADGDNYIDIFTTNHSANQSLMINRGDLQFDAQFHEKKLSQSRGFPSVEDSLKVPEFNKPGLYIYRKERWLYIQAYKLPSDEPIAGKLSMPWSVEIDKNQTDDKVVKKIDSENGKSTVEFSLIENELLVLNGAGDMVEIPNLFAIDHNVSLDRIFVGISSTHPNNHSFILEWRDRHGIAWSDVDGDRKIDAFIVRGGLKGQLGNTGNFVVRHGRKDQLGNVDNLYVSDELFIQDVNGNFQDKIYEFGFKKEACPGRSVNWVDINSDLKLDLHIVCGRSTTELTFPDQIWQRQGLTNFSEIGESIGMANPGPSVGIWVDFNNNGFVDYIASQSDGILFYENQQGRFIKHLIYEGDRQNLRDFSAVDFDSDGDIDLLGVGKKGSLFITNHQGFPKVELTDKYGLPSKSNAVNWVDYDNDGLIDIHFVPQGIFRQEPEGKFVSTNLLKFRKSPSSIYKAQCSFFDANNNGSIDSICGLVYKPSILERVYKKITLGDKPTSEWATFFHINTYSDNNWLQVKLIGPPMNQEAIGAKIFVKTNLGAQMRHIGHAEGARLSQGHYRTYFGLGTSNKVDHIRIVWPDGHEETHNEVEANKLQIYQYGNRIPATIGSG